MLSKFLCSSTFSPGFRYFSSTVQRNKNFFGGKKRPLTTRQKNDRMFWILMSLGVATAGAAYAAVPLYRMFCQSTGYGGTVVEGHDPSKVAHMKKEKTRSIRIQFNADTESAMLWNFKPQQSEIEVSPGETALAFYTAKNPSPKPIDGISTYNVVPYGAGKYFNKIQCFCFEEQRLNPNEEVDMPVFFYIDPEFANDPFMENVDTIILSYTFFASKPGLELPAPPSFMSAKS